MMHHHAEPPAIVRAAELDVANAQRLTLPDIHSEGKTIDITFEDVDGLVDFKTFSYIKTMPLKLRRSALRLAISPLSFQPPRYVEVDAKTWLVGRVF